MNDHLTKLGKLKLNDFKKGYRVLYVPYHAKGVINHPDCRKGAVSSINNIFVFVKYDNLDCIMKTGDEDYTAQGTKPEQLIILNKGE